MECESECASVSPIHIDSIGNIGNFDSFDNIGNIGSIGEIETYNHITRTNAVVLYINIVVLFHL